MEYRTQPAHAWRRTAFSLAVSLVIPATAVAETTLDRIIDEKIIRVAVANEQPLHRQRR